MTSHAEQAPKRIDVLIINDDGDMPSVLNPLSGQIFFTNKVGKHVLELADGRLKAEEIAERVARRYAGAPTTVIHDEVLAFLEDSSTKGLVTWARP